MVRLKQTKSGESASFSKECVMACFRIIAIAIMTLMSLAVWVPLQKIDTVKGVRIIHNEKVGRWGGSPEVKLELINKIGEVDALDGNLAFMSPCDIVLDSTGNYYFLDSGNARIQKMDRAGRFERSIGRKGQGPAEFQYPFSLDMDERDLLYVYDGLTGTIQTVTTTGELKKTIRLSSPGQNFIRRLSSGRIAIGKRIKLGAWMENGNQSPKLIEIIDADGKKTDEFCEAEDYGNPNVNSHANQLRLDKDWNNNVYVSFLYQNRIEKYSLDGALLWKADRTLNFGTAVIDKGSVERDESGIIIQPPRMNLVSLGLAVDGFGRIWVITSNRQMKPEEEGLNTPVGRRKVEPTVAVLDVFKLEIYAQDGILLGSIPLNHLAHGIRIFKDQLFIWERNNAVFYQYRIIKKQE
jgi:hypothetical protein